MQGTPDNVENAPPEKNRERSQEEGGQGEAAGSPEAPTGPSSPETEQEPGTEQDPDKEGPTPDAENPAA
jgi:hypothetical protein